MKKLLLLSTILLSACSNGTNHSTFNPESYGVFLGADSSSIERISKYEKVIIDIDEFEEDDITYLKNKGCEIYAYLSIGSLETYRPYYEAFKDLTFMDYENWPNERWIDVSDSSWQNHLSEEANRFKTSKIDGVFMDNFDVYYIVCEEYECSRDFKEAIFNGCKNILNDLSSTGLKLIINSGTDFLERINEENSEILDKISCYCQECVFSSIVDYDNDVFSSQEEETHEYYLNIINMMDKHSEILLLEYTKDETLMNKIKSFCETNKYQYYISSSIDLKI